MGPILQGPGVPRGIWFTLPTMRFKAIFQQLREAGSWPRELALAAGALLIGFGVMPGLIFFTGSAALGRYEGASVTRSYSSVFDGLAAGSAASWTVVLGPYGFYLLFKALRAWWRLSARLA